MGVSQFPAVSTSTNERNIVYTLPLTAGTTYQIPNCATSAVYSFVLEGSSSIQAGTNPGLAGMYATLGVIVTGSTEPRTIRLRQEKEFTIVGSLSSFTCVTASEGAVIRIVSATTSSVTTTTGVGSNAGGSGALIPAFKAYEYYYSTSSSTIQGWCYTTDDTQMWYLTKDGYFYLRTLSDNSTVSKQRHPRTSNTSHFRIYDDGGNTLYTLAFPSSGTTIYFDSYNKTTNTWTSRTSWTYSTWSNSSFAHGAPEPFMIVSNKFYSASLMNTNTSGPAYIDLSTYTRTTFTAPTGSTYGASHQPLNGKWYMMAVYDIAQGVYGANKYALSILDPATNTWTYNTSYGTYGGFLFRWNSTTLGVCGGQINTNSAANVTNYFTAYPGYTLRTFDTTTSTWTTQTLTTFPRVAHTIGGNGGTGASSAITYTRPSAAYDKTFNIYYEELSTQRQMYNGDGAGEFVDFRSNGNTIKSAPKKIGYGTIRPWLHPGRDWCLGFGMASKYNRNGGSVAHEPWSPWYPASAGTGNNAAGVAERMGVTLISSDGSEVRSMLQNWDFSIGCYDVHNGGAWYLGGYEYEDATYGTTASYIIGRRWGFVKINESDLSWERIGGSGGPNTNFGTSVIGAWADNDSVRGGGTCWVYNGKMFVLVNTNVSSGSIMYVNVFDMQYGQLSTISWYYNNSSYSQLSITPSDGTVPQPASVSYNEHLKYASWVGFNGMSITTIAPEIETPAPMFWNGAELFSVSPFDSTGSGAYASGGALVSVEAGGRMNKRPPSVWIDRAAGRFIGETLTGFVDISLTAPSTSAIYQYGHSTTGNKVIPRQIDQYSTPATYSHQWTTPFAPRAGYWGARYGVFAPKAMMGNVQLNFGTFANLYTPSGSAYYQSFTDGTYTKTIV